jgi:hypothetical protein
MSGIYLPDIFFLFNRIDITARAEILFNPLFFTHFTILFLSKSVTPGYHPEFALEAALVRSKCADIGWIIYERHRL